MQWLPNQLSAVMDLMVEIYDAHLKDKAASTPIDGPTENGKPDFIAAYRKQIAPMMEQVHDQREKLAREVDRWCKERGVQAK
jgi:indoleamine 2,3-dioxygenase